MPQTNSTETKAFSAAVLTILAMVIISVWAPEATARTYVACRPGSAAPEKVMAACERDIAAALNDAARAMAYQSRGNVFRLRKQTGKALADWAEAIRLYPAASPSYFNMGVVYLSEKPVQLEKALERFSAFIKLRPQDGKGWYARALTHAKAGHEALAVKDFMKAHQCGSRAAMLELKKRGLKPGPSLKGCD